MVVFGDLEVEVGEGEFGEEGGVADLGHGIDKSFVEIGLCGKQEIMKYLRAFKEEGVIDTFYLRVFVCLDQHLTEGNECNPGVCQNPFFAVKTNVGVLKGEPGVFDLEDGLTKVEQAVMA